MLIVPRNRICYDESLFMSLVPNDNYKKVAPDFSGKINDFSLVEGLKVEKGYGVVLDGDGWVEMVADPFITSTRGTIAMWIRPDFYDEVSSDETSSESSSETYETYHSIYIIFSQFWTKIPKNNYIVCGLTNSGRLYQDVYSIDLKEKSNAEIQKLAEEIASGAGSLYYSQYEDPQIAANNSCITQSSSDDPEDDKKNIVRFERWSHIAFVKTKDYVPYSMYINGIKCDVKKNSSYYDKYGWKWTAGVNMDANDPSNMKYTIGYFNSEKLHGYKCSKFEGVITLLNIWNRSLSDEEISYLYFLGRY